MFSWQKNCIIMNLTSFKKLLPWFRELLFWSNLNVILVQSEIFRLLQVTLKLLIMPIANWFSKRKPNGKKHILGLFGCHHFFEEQKWGFLISLAPAFFSLPPHSPIGWTFWLVSGMMWRPFFTSSESFGFSSLKEQHMKPIWKVLQQWWW